MEKSNFEDFYNKYYYKVYNIAFLMTKSREIAEDMTADAFVTALQSIEKLEDEKNFGKWISKIVANKCKDFFKKKKPVLFSEFENTNEEQESILPELADDDMQIDPSGKTEINETLQVVREMLNNLPEDQRLCLLLFCDNQMKLSEIADTLGLSENTVKSKINYARKKMNSQKDEYEKNGNRLYATIGLFPLLRNIINQKAAISTPSDMLNRIKQETNALKNKNQNKNKEGIKMTELAEKIKNLSVAKKIIGAIIIIAAASGFISSLYINNRTPTIDVAPYISINYSGANKYVYVSYDIDYQSMADEVLAVQKKSKRTTLAETREFLAKNLKVTILADGKEIKENEICDLSNGNNITLIAKFNSTLEEKTHVHYICSEKEEQIYGLKDTTMIDAFSNDLLNVSFSGVNGNGHWKIISNKELDITENNCRITYYEQSHKERLTLKVTSPNNNVAYLNYEIVNTDPNYNQLGYTNLKNGDKCIKVIAKLSNVINDEIDLLKEEKVLTVEGLYDPITSIKQVSEEQINQLFQKIADSLKSKKNVKNIKLKEAHLYKANRNALYLNTIYLTFSYDVDGFFSFKNQEYKEAFYDVYIDKDGKIGFEKNQQSWYWERDYDLVD